MSSTGTTTSISSGLRMPASTIVTGRRDAGRRRSRRGSGRSPRAGAAWPTARCAAGGSSHELPRAARATSGEVGAPLGGRQRVDLVDDHGLDVAQRLPRRRREHQVERLGRGDQEVGRVADERAALVGRACRRCACRPSGACSGDARAARPRAAMPGERRAQVLLDVDGERPQRRHVEDARSRRSGRSAAEARRTAGRSPTGTRRASCPNRWAPGSACGRRAAIAGQPCAWARVGAWNEVANHSRTAGEKTSRATATNYPCPRHPGGHR